MSEQKINKDVQPGPPSPLGKEPEVGAFYIGWMAKAPKSFAKHVKRVLLILFPIALIVPTSNKIFQFRGLSSFGFGFEPRDLPFRNSSTSSQLL